MSKLIRKVKVNAKISHKIYANIFDFNFEGKIFSLDPFQKR